MPGRSILLFALDRRRFLHTAAALTAASLAAIGQVTEADKARRFRLGIVSYNIADHGDLPTILKICKSVGQSPVELRTTH